MAVVEVADQYVFMMYASLLFTALAIIYYKENSIKSVLVSFLATFCWVTTTLGHFAVGDKTSGLTASLAWLFLAFALIFGIVSVTKTTDLLNKQPDKDWWKQ